MQESQAFLAPGTGFMEDNFPTDWGRGWFLDDSSTLHLLCTLFLLLLHQLHLRSTGIRSRRLGTTALEEVWWFHLPNKHFLVMASWFPFVEPSPSSLPHYSQSRSLGEMSCSSISRRFIHVFLSPDGSDWFKDRYVILA